MHIFPPDTALAVILACCVKVYSIVGSPHGVSTSAVDLKRASDKSSADYMRKLGNSPAAERFTMYTSLVERRQNDPTCMGRGLDGD